MPPASFLHADLADLLGRGGSVVTGNKRAARTLRLAYDRQCRAKGLASWQPPAVLAWDSWTASLYRKLLLDGNATRVLLNRTQELRVWRAVIEADGHWTSLKTVDSLAVMAADAWQLLCAYRGQRRLNGLGVSGDTRALQRWAQAFVGRCTADAYLSAAELEEMLVSSGASMASTAEIRMLGFDRKTPAQRALIEALRDRGIQIVEDQPDAPAASVHLAPAESPADELAQAALWVRGHLAANPQATVAVIVPGLGAERREIDRVFRQILAPELEDITAGADAGPYEFSLGQPLASTPMVAVALELLRFSVTALPLAGVTRLLLSPHVTTGQSEFFARAEFDAFHLRNLAPLRPEMTLGRLISLVARSKYSSRLSGLHGQLRAFERTVARLLTDPVPGQAPRQRPFSEWAEAVRELLESVGWPGSRPLASPEFQTRQKFDSALDELATLDFEGVRTTFIEALAQLEAILRRTLFAPESREAPVQIMSPLEAAGSRFDALFFLRASDLEWPVRTTTNPLLGWRLQRELAMPGSDASLDAAHARSMTRRTAASAETVVFSYAKMTENGHQRPSPMLAELSLEPSAPMEPAAVAMPVELESVEDQAFIPLTNFTVRGGAGVLKAQATCGFRAFAEKRLWSTPIKELEPGMDALERGNVVHLALEHLWSELGTQAALRALTPEGRAAQLSASIEHSLYRAAARLAADPTASAWDAAYLDLQRKRLQRVIGPWLEIELARPAFEVTQREERETVTIGPLTMDLRIDRIDRLLDEAGGNVLIDYKTGQAKPAAWASDRPDEPQLPLYAVLHQPESLAAVAFANIRAGKELALQGFAAREGVLLKSLKKSAKMPSLTFQDQLEDWHRVLIALANDFADGDARVRPKVYPLTCKHCDQRLLCRVDPASLLSEDEEEEEEEEVFEGTDA